MSRFELRWIKRHPLRWIRIAWWHWTIAVLFAAKAAIITNDIWQVTPADRYWPIVLGGAAFLSATSAVAPRDERLQMFTSVVLFFIAAMRAATYVAVLATPTSETVNSLAAAFTIHWLIIATVATRWELLSRIAGAHLAAEAMQDDRGRG